MDPTSGMSKEDEARFVAAIRLIGRTGSQQFQMRWSDDEVPTVWMAVATYEGDRADAAAALSPLQALLRLCEQIIDGGRCAHCLKPSGFEPTSLDTMPMDELVCWYQWDPENKTYRRGCE